MQNRNFLRTYLLSIPFIAVIIAFALGHSPYRIYLPVWFLHSCLMCAAAWKLGVSQIRSPDPEKRQLAAIALFMILPWVFITIFAGMGPPPATIAGWMDSAPEQQMRYVILIAAGVLFTAGLVILGQQLRSQKEHFYSLLAIIALLTKAPLYILDMLYLGVYRTSLCGIYTASGSSARPDWPIPIREMFYALGMVEVALTYAATAAFAVALRKTGWIGRAGSRAYLFFSALGFVLSLMPASVPDVLGVPSYLVSIPAITFIMPYFMAIGLLWKAPPGQPGTGTVA